MMHLGKTIAPPRFVLFCLAFPLAVFAATRGLPLGRATLVGFDAASALFLVTIYPLLRRGEAERMRSQAKRNDANRAVLLGITGAVMLVVLVAVANELQGKNDATAVALAVGTLALAWLFSNIIYALHYAHLYYGDDDGAGGDDQCIIFPGTKEPDYWDFIYFSFTLGMTFQTSDTDITSRRIRHAVTGQCLAAFVFNLGVLGFTINVLGG